MLWWNAYGRSLSHECLQPEHAGAPETASPPRAAADVVLDPAWSRSTYTHRSFGLNRQGQITERCTRAVDQLGNRASRDVRLGGIYALERLARESADDHGPIVEILTAYVREHAPAPSEEHEEELIQMAPEEYPRPPEADVQAALTVLGRRRSGHDPPAPWRLDLAGAYLPRADLRGAGFRRANLSYAVLTQAVLRGADLWEAELRGARLYQADLTGAQLGHARCERARLNQATMVRARMPWAHFDGAQLRHAQLHDARMQGVDLSDANLAQADLTDADMRGATLIEANLEQAVLIGATLIGAELAGANLREAGYSSGTAWPGGFDVKSSGAVRKQEE